MDTPFKQAPAIDDRQVMQTISWGDAVSSTFPKGKQHGDFEGFSRIHK